MTLGCGLTKGARSVFGREHGSFGPIVFCSHLYRRLRISSLGALRLLKRSFAGLRWYSFDICAPKTHVIENREEVATMKRNILHILFLAVGISMALLSTTAVAGLITLADGNSVVNINPGPSSLADGVNGVNFWSVNGAGGTNQLQQQWFWYRIGDSGPELSIDTLAVGGSVSAVQFDTGIASVTYSNPTKGLSVKVLYTLTGGSSLDGHSDLGESITIKNTSNSAKTIHFFQYSNFDLQGTPGGDNLHFSLNTQSGKVNAVTQTKGLSSLTETVVTPSADHYEGNTFSNTLSSLNDSGPTTLADAPPVGTIWPFPGTGDMTWAFQWDPVIQPGGTFIISKDKRLDIDPLTIVPEPSTFALLLCGGLGLLGWRRRRA